jgi:hypothetical protein
VKGPHKEVEGRPVGYILEQQPRKKLKAVWGWALVTTHPCKCLQDPSATGSAFASAAMPIEKNVTNKKI